MLSNGNVKIELIEHFGCDDAFQIVKKTEIINKNNKRYQNK